MSGSLIPEMTSRWVCSCLQFSSWKWNYAVIRAWSLSTTILKVYLCGDKTYITTHFPLPGRLVGVSRDSLLWEQLPLPFFCMCSWASLIWTQFVTRVILIKYQGKSFLSDSSQALEQIAWSLWNFILVEVQSLT